MSEILALTDQKPLFGQQSLRKPAMTLPAQDTAARSRLVARDSRGTVIGSREVLFGEGLTTQLREWIAADNWPGLCEGMTISVEPANADSLQQPTGEKA